MNLKYLKLSVVAIALALVTYIFFPVSAKHTKQTMASSAQKSESVHADFHVKAAQTKTDKRQHPRKKSKSKSHALAKAKAKGQKIEPEKTLRQEQTSSRSGPPSKMYGGL